MTEQELRQQVADVMYSWLGAGRGSATHLEILRIYNNHQPLARNYKVQVGDAYCATTASAAYIFVGIADYTGTECGCDKFIEIAKKKGIWVEDDAHVPKIGEACLYDWDDSGSGDNRGSADHIGIVVKSGNGTFEVIEGNGSGGRVVKRTMSVNGRYIRGFICPDFAKIAAIMSGDEEDDMKEAEVQAMIDKAVKAVTDSSQKKFAEIDKALNEIQPTAPTKPQILSALKDQWINTYADLPPWAQPEVMEMIEQGIIKGKKKVNTPEETVIDGSLEFFIRPAIIAYRAAKILAKDAPKEVVVAELTKLLELYKGSSKE